MHVDLGKVDYADQHSLWASKQIAKYRVQIPVALVITLVIQILIVAVQYGEILQTAEFNSVIINSICLTFVANFLSFIAYRRLRHYPGTRRIAFIFPSFVTTWACILACLLVARLAYSSLLLGVGFFCGVCSTLIFNALVRQALPFIWLVIPSERVFRMLGELPNLKWELASVPEQVANARQPIIVDLRAEMSPQWEAAIAKVAVEGVPVFHVKQLRESLTGRVQIEHLSENATGLLAPDPTYALLKTMVERAAAALLLLVIWPLLLLVAIAIRLETQGPALFRQTRIGFKGRPFTILKLRTMTHDGGQCPRALLSDMTQENDYRITRIGCYLRRTRMDELPQLFNVIRGHMSLVGPRPETENLSAWYREEIEFYAYRHSVRPGITGWAQVNQGHVISRADVMRKLEYDLFYIKHYSLWLDLVIILKTIWVIGNRLGSK